MRRADRGDTSIRFLQHAARLGCCTLIMLFFALGTARASGPRWVTGPPYFNPPYGSPVLWTGSTILYWTDPGDLSASVDHAAADALVAAAMRLWNVPTARFTLTYGGALDEHVSGANAYLGSAGPVFPADVQSANYTAKQIAVIYDSDGSVTDMLLGGGASSPAECRQNAVTDDVDLISPAGAILHAMLIVNGRCTGPAPEQQLQLQYQLERSIGRVLGFAWSQTNDNVFTQTPAPTYGQAMHWPILHPIDIVCGLYTYQCLPQPFQLRDDDLSSISGLYGMVNWGMSPAVPAPPGKTWTFYDASQMFGGVYFPDGQGMQGVNVLVTRQAGSWGTPEAWVDVSSVSGAYFQRDAGNPVTGVRSGVEASIGTADATAEGFYNFGWIPDIDPPNAPNGSMSGIVTTEAINPLYIGAYAVGPYAAGEVSPSGTTPPIPTPYTLAPYWFPYFADVLNATPAGGAAACSSGNDGTEAAPAQIASSGWWNDVLCAHGHSAWSSFAMKAGRTATVEITALDESSFATTGKAMPLVGAWSVADPTGTLPSLAATPSALNSTTLGMTTLALPSTTAGGVRLVVADARGDGRPDFAYQGRVLYADTVQPAALGTSGGPVTIQGMGFRDGNAVQIGGVAAVVTSWTANTIVAVAPPASAFAGAPTAPVDVTVTDLSTHGSTVISGAVTYGGGAPDELKLISAPTGTVATGTVASLAFAVRVVGPDGVSPIVGVPVTFSSVGGSIQFGGCPPLACVVLTDASGLASVTVDPLTFGSVTLSASAVGASVTASFLAQSRSLVALQPTEYVAAGATVAWTADVNAVQNGAPASGLEVDWTGSPGMTFAAPVSHVDSAGVASQSVVLGPLAAGSQASGQACAWAAAVCAGISAVGVDPVQWRLGTVSGAAQSVGVHTTFAPVVVQVTDGAGHAVAGSPVAIHQVVDAAAPPCPVLGRCPAPQPLASSDGAAVSDLNGLVSVVPMQVPGVAEVTNLAIASGTQAFLSLAITQGP